MRAISLWQPWASAIAVDAKRIETRDWYTGYRGPLAIHAAKRMVKRELADFDMDPEWIAALGTKEPLATMLPFGAIVAICYLSDCRRTESFPGEELDSLRHRDGWQAGWCERDMGDFTPGRWGWVLDHITPLMEPLPYKGMQGFFDVPDHLFDGRFGA